MFFKGALGNYLPQFDNVEMVVSWENSFYKKDIFFQCTAAVRNTSQKYFLSVITKKISRYLLNDDSDHNEKF